MIVLQIVDFLDRERASSPPIDRCIRACRQNQQQHPGRPSNPRSEHWPSWNISGRRNAPPRSARSPARSTCRSQAPPCCSRACSISATWTTRRKPENSGRRFRVAVLGNWIQQSLFKSGPLTDTMDAIGEATGGSVLLGLQNGPHMQYVHIVIPSQGVLLGAQIGILRPMTCAALGRVLPNRKTNEEIKAIIRRNNADAQDNAPPRQGAAIHGGDRNDQQPGLC